MTLERYIGTLKAENRPLAREYGAMPAPEFQARMGPAVDLIISRLDALQPPSAPRRGLSRIAAVRIGDIVKGIAGAILAVVAIVIRESR